MLLSALSFFSWNLYQPPNERVTLFCPVIQWNEFERTHKLIRLEVVIAVIDGKDNGSISLNQRMQRAAL